MASTTLIIVVLSQVYVTNSITSCVTSICDKKAKVTCIFDENVADTQHNFNVVHYPDDMQGSGTNSAKYALLCNWNTQKVLECKEEHGYSFNYKVSNQLELVMPNVNESDNGMFACQLVPGDGSTPNTCTLNYTDSQPKYLVVTEPKSSTVRPEHLEDFDWQLGFFILAGSLAVSVILIIIGACVLCRRSTRKKEDYWYTGRIPETEALLGQTPASQHTRRGTNALTLQTFILVADKSEQADEKVSEKKRISSAMRTIFPAKREKQEQKETVPPPLGNERLQGMLGEIVMDGRDIEIAKRHQKDCEKTIIAQVNNKNWPVRQTDNADSFDVTDSAQTGNEKQNPQDNLSETSTNSNLNVKGDHFSDESGKGSSSDRKESPTASAAQATPQRVNPGGNSSGASPNLQPHNERGEDNVYQDMNTQEKTAEPFKGNRK